MIHLNLADQKGYPKLPACVRNITEAALPMPRNLHYMTNLNIAVFPFLKFDLPILSYIWYFRRLVISSLRKSMSYDKLAVAKETAKNKVPLRYLLHFI